MNDQRFQEFISKASNQILISEYTNNLGYRDEAAIKVQILKEEIQRRIDEDRWTYSILTGFRLREGTIPPAS